MSDVKLSDRQVSEMSVQSPHDPDEINLLEYIYALVKNKWWIIGLTAAGLVGGYIAAKMKGPTWVAEVVIAPKETETQKTPNLSSFGAFGGIVASQLNIGGNASLDKIELLLDSRDFNARLIEKFKLLPTIYRVEWPKQYEKQWDSTAGTWKKSFLKPELLGMGAFLKGKYLKKTTNSNNTMKLEVRTKDSTLSLSLAQKYVSFLDEDIKTSVRNDAKENVDFLEKQLLAISDPLLREKLQGLIADEIEKTMVVSKEAFRVVDPVFLSRTFKEKKLYPLVFGAGVFFLLVVLIVFLHAFSSSEKTEEDRRLMERIQREIFPWGKSRS